MLSMRERKCEEDQPWECMVQFEDVDWNDLVEAEESGDTMALERLKCPLRSNCSDDRSTCSDEKSDGREESEEPLMEENKQPPLPPVHCATPLSYAQVVGPAQQGVKRRFSFSPSDHRSRRSAKYSRMTDSSPCSESRPHNIAATPDGTPESDTQKTTWNGFAQRRLFSSPSASPASTGKNSPSQQPLEELTPHRLCQRQKQIDFGKNTVGYQRYIQTIPKWERKLTDPCTPDKSKQSSTRAWQGQIRQWRRALHAYDPQTIETFTSSDAALCNVSSLSAN